MKRGFPSLSSLVIDRPWVTVVCLIAMTMLSAWGYRDPDLFRRWWYPAAAQTDAGAAEEPGASAKPAVEPLSVSRADAIVVIESDGIFTNEGAAAVRAAVAALEALEYVDEILWLDRLPPLNLFGLPEPILPRTKASPQRMAAAREKALQHPLVAGQLLSADGTSLLLMIRFRWLFVENDEDCIERLREVAEHALAAFPSVRCRVGVTGAVPLRLTAMKQHDVNQLRYQLVGYGTIAVMALFLFRGLVAVFVVALAPSLGVFWTLGILRFLDLHENPFNDVVLPVMLSLVGLTDGVHLLVQIRRLRVEGLSERDAAREGMREVGLACALTSLTTAIGFGSLALAHHEIVREFGWCCVLGVTLTFLAVMTVVPLACSTWLGKRVQVGYEKGVIDRNLGRVAGIINAVLKRPRLVSTTAIVCTCILTAISLTLRPDERNANALPDQCEPLQMLRHLDRVLGGLEMSNVAIHWNPDVDSDSPEVLQVVRKVDQLLSGETLLGHPISIRNLLQALPGDGEDEERMSLLELLPPPLKRAFYEPEDRRAQVNFRVQDLGIARYGPVFQRIEAGLAQIAQAHPGFSLFLEGHAAWRWRNLYQIVVDLAASLGSAMVIILLSLAIAYRSVRIGLIALVPNLFPLAVTGAYLKLTGQALELVSVCAFTICLGIAVDDTIHFLTRFREEQRKTADRNEALRRAFVGVGSALIMTTVILIAGMLTVLFSGLRDHRIFATMGTLTLSAALFGDLVFLPAMLSCFAPQPPRKPRAADPSVTATRL